MIVVVMVSLNDKSIKIYFDPEPSQVRLEYYITEEVIDLTSDSDTEEPITEVLDLTGDSDDRGLHLSMSRYNHVTHYFAFYPPISIQEYINKQQAKYHSNATRTKLVISGIQ